MNEQKNNTQMEGILAGPVLVTPKEARARAEHTDLPANTYDFLGGLEKLYSTNPFDPNPTVNRRFLLVAAFLAGAVHAVKKSGNTGQEMEDVTYKLSCIASNLRELLDTLGNEKGARPQLVDALYIPLMALEHLAEELDEGGRL